MAKRRIHLTEGRLYNLIERAIREHIDIHTTVYGMQCAYISNATDGVRFIKEHKDDDVDWTYKGGGDGEIDISIGHGTVLFSERLKEWVKSCLEWVGKPTERSWDDENTWKEVMEFMLERIRSIPFYVIPTEDDEEDDEEIRYSAIQAEVEKAMKLYGIDQDNTHMRDFLSDYFYDHYDWDGGFEYDDYDLFSEIKDEMTRVKMYGESVVRRVTESVMRKLRRIR